MSRLAATYGRNVFALLRTARSPPVALHLASRQQCSHSGSGCLCTGYGHLQPHHAKIRHVHDLEFFTELLLQSTAKIGRQSLLIGWRNLPCGITLEGYRLDDDLVVISPLCSRVEIAKPRLSPADVSGGKEGEIFAQEGCPTLGWCLDRCDFCRRTAGAEQSRQRTVTARPCKTIPLLCHLISRSGLRAHQDD